MKKGFLKCLALSLVLVSSLQFGSFAARKNISSYSYTPKLQLAGVNANKFYGKYKLHESYLHTSNSFSDKIFELISDKLNELGIKADFDIKSTKKKLKVNRDGSGFVSVSSKVNINISGIESTSNSTLKIRFYHKNDNTFAYDFDDFINVVNAFASAGENLSSTDDLDIESIKELLTFSLSFEPLTEKHFNEVKASLGYLSEFFPELNENDINLNLEIGKEYLIERNALGMITGIYEEA